MHARQRRPLPQDRQSGLPAGILYQPDHVGGSLAVGTGAKLEPLWDKIEAEAAAAAAGPGGSSPNLRQTLTNFVFRTETVSGLVIPYSATRAYLMLQNVGAANIFVAFGREADVTAGFRIVAGGFYEPIFGTTSSVHAIAAAGTQSLIVIEGFRSA